MSTVSSCLQELIQDYGVSKGMSKELVNYVYEGITNRLTNNWSEKTFINWAKHGEKTFGMTVEHYKFVHDLIETAINDFND